MPTDFAFRFSTYLTLFLATLCIGYAEWDYLPEVSIFTGIVTLLLGVAFWGDHRGRQLSLLQANILGGVIFLLALFWASYHYRRNESLMNTLPWPAGGLPYLAALMMLLVPAKLFRPKHVGDWWALQGLGLSLVAVACAMTDDALFVLFITSYMLASIWSLTLFYIRRSAGHIPPPPPFVEARGASAIFSPQTYLPRWLFVARSRPTVAEPFVGVGQPTPVERLGRSHFTRAAQWLVAIALVALPLFLITPRGHGRQWELFGAKMETGISSFGVDLARTGELKVSQAPAFTVFAKNRDGTPASLSEDQRFRVSTYFSYQYPRGKWNRGVLPTPVFRIPGATPQTVGQTLWPPQPRLRFPDLGNQAIVLEYVLDRSSYGMPLADPMFHVPGDIAPAAFEFDGQFYHADFVGDGTFRFPVARSASPETRRYKQLTRPGLADEPAAYYQLDSRYAQEMISRQSLVEVPSKKIAEFTKKLYERLLKEKSIPAEVETRRNPFSQKIAETDHYLVAKAFETYLGGSGEYEYTLNLRIHDRTIDPIEDFLLNTKAGHCEKFASGLMMILRAMNIPARFVHGYRGCEYLEDGVYQVRQDHAHAWVEILVAETKSGRSEPLWSWRTLDATSGSVEGQSNSDTAANTSPSRRFINWLITGLNSETQQQIGAFLVRNAKSYGLLLLAGLTALLGFVLGFRQYRRRQVPLLRSETPPIDPVPWYTSFVDCLRRHGCVPQSTQTPNEFAAQASAWLHGKPSVAMFAQLPRRYADVLDEQRYANGTIRQETYSELSQELLQLEKQLTDSRAG
jgi:protein-glutamine gamma-glutamyltransferase